MKIKKGNREMRTRKWLLNNNLNCIFGMYANGISDCGEEEYPLLTEEEAIKYAIPEIYNMWNDGAGYTQYGNGISKELRFLGNHYIHEQIIKIAEECGVLK
jgi:hypothetical protein